MHSTWLPPFAALVASSEINRYKIQNPNVRISCSNYEKQTYGAHIGFFRSFGLQWGNWPGEAGGGENYLPISFVDCAAIRETAGREGEEPAVVVERLAEQRIAPVLARSAKGDLFEALSYSLREIMRNVVEHSGTSRLAYCAQHWPKNGRVEVGILDWGVGLKASLSQNPELKISSDQDAVHLALMPGISGKGALVKKMKHKTVWTNSGFGLYMTSRLCRNGGSFLLGSGESAALLAVNDVSEMKWGIPGTAVKMEIQVNRLGAISNMLEQFRVEAYKFRNGLSDTEFLTASMASRALRGNFSNYSNRETGSG